MSMFPTVSQPTSRIAHRLAPFGTTIFTEMTRLANEHGAVNLSQGFPDFDGPDFVKAAAVAALRVGGEGHNQYARMSGVPSLNAAIAAAWKRDTGFDIDPDGEVTVTTGCTEALAATFIGLLNPGDEVVMFQPFFDSYRACAAMAGARVRYVTLRPPAPGEPEGAPFRFDPDELRRAFTGRTRAILVNTPHNPTGKVYTREELTLIADLCTGHDAVAITDDVYERLTFEGALPHVRMATLPGMAARTVHLSSIGKAFSLTGWKIGWAIAPPPLTAAVRAAHQFLTFCTAAPLQHGAAAAVAPDGPGGAYVEGLLAQYRVARAYLGGALRRLGFRVYMPAGTYFIMADHTAFGPGDDLAFCRRLATEIGVAAIPPSVFYDDPDAGGGRSLVRFAFCKKMETLERAVARLERLRPAG